MIQPTMPVLDWLVRLTILLAGAYALSLLLRRAAAVVKYRLWIGALAALFAGPVVAHWLRIPVPIPAAALTRSTQRAVGASPTAVRATEATPAVPIGEPQAPPTTTISPLELATSAWLVIVLALLARLVWSGAIVRDIIAHGRQLNDCRWTDLLYDTADRLGMDRVPVLFLSDRTQVPLACRFHRPAVVLPAGADEWSEERRRVVLLHELAHIKRRDLVGHTLSRLACAVYWFHPLVWYAAQRLRSESERACDDLALEGGAKPSDYAQQLLSMVAELRSDAAPATAMAMAVNREFEGRIVAILDPGVARRPRNRRQGVLPITMVLSFGLLLAVAQPAARAATPSIGQAPQRAAIAELPRDTALLRRMLQTDPSAEVRANVAWSLHERPDAAALLVVALRSDRNASVREMAVWALGQHGDTAVLSVLYTHLQREPAATVRATTAWAIGQLHGRATMVLLPLLSDGDTNVIRMALWAIGQTPSRVAPAAVLDHLRHSDNGIRFYAAWSLGEIADTHAVSELQRALTTEQDAIIRLAILRALFESGDRSSALLDAAQRWGDAETRLRATQVRAGQKPRPWMWPLPLPDPRPVR